MTPAERARQIDEQERLAESAVILRRALAYSQAKRDEERARLDAALGRPLPKQKTAPGKGRPSKLYTHNGESKTLTEWSLIARVPYNVFAQRIRSGMPFEKAVTMKFGQRAELHTINGVSKTFAQWAAYAGCKYDTLFARMRTRSLADAVAMSRPLPERRYADALPSFELPVAEVSPSNAASASAPFGVNSISSSDLNVTYPRPIALATVMGCKSSPMTRSVPLSSSCRSSLITDASEAGMAESSPEKTDDRVRICVLPNAESTDVEVTKAPEPLQEAGVPSDLPAIFGTGGGSTTQETLNIDFSQDATA